ncbi:DUF791-domain-containing protein [Pluteus cervinus]|uniref:DUF791-domain-containing protein n=1 Tax=Pluteus cervinus TaxID=181527 RepID=A0ACD3B6K7_9AGAR|nr:DUF791-domain-containing protein [Pluteus cervinus]
MPSIIPPASRFYERQLFFLVGTCFCALLFDHFVVSRWKSKANPSGDDSDTSKPRNSSGDRPDSAGEFPSAALKTSYGVLSKKYLLVYAIVMGADWLQGPYIYTLYNSQYNYPSTLIAVLFLTGFLSAAIFAPLIGIYADRYGRRKLCLVFCITYAASCFLILLNWFPILMAGRVLGGFSTSILFSAFEAWVIAEIKNRFGAGLTNGSTSGRSGDLEARVLSKIMGRATLVNGLVAVLAGVVSNKLVSMMGTYGAPFIASAALLGLSWIIIKGSWGENYGLGGSGAHNNVPSLKGGLSEALGLGRLGQAWAIVKSDPILLALGLTQTCFEGSMYLFVFVWVPALQEISDSTMNLPLGYIFSSFMLCMMLGSLLYTAIVSWVSSSKSKTKQSKDTSLVLHAKLSSLVVAFAGLTLALSVKSSTERERFWAFCLFEASVGMYYPVQGMLRGLVVNEEYRATLSALFRVPLNVFVVISMLMGASEARYTVLMVCALMLVISSLITGNVIIGRSSSGEKERIGGDQ